MSNQPTLDEALAIALDRAVEINYLSPALLMRIAALKIAGPWVAHPSNSPRTFICWQRHTLYGTIVGEVSAQSDGTWMGSVPEVCNLFRPTFQEVTDAVDEVLTKQGVFLCPLWQQRRNPFDPLPTEEAS